MEWCSQIRALLSDKGKKLIQFFVRSVIGFALFLIPTSVFAQGIQDISQILFNLRSIIVPLTTMVLMISFVAGIFFIFRALGLMKKFGINATMAGGQTETGQLSVPLVYLCIGTALIYLPTTSDTLMNSVFGMTESIFSNGSVNYQALGQGSSILGYSAGVGIDQYWADLANTLFLYLQFLGFLSFVRGLFILSKVGAHGGQPGTFSKGVTHIIGGIGLVNIYGLISVVQNTIMGY